MVELYNVEDEYSRVWRTSIDDIYEWELLDYVMEVDPTSEKEGKKDSIHIEKHWGGWIMWYLCWNDI